MTPARRDRIAGVLLAIAPMGVLATVVALGLDLAWRATGLTPALLAEGPRDAGRAGGLFPFLIATGWVLAIALAVAVPVGLAAAVWLAEYARSGPREARLVGASLDVVAAVPSIVFGLFGLAVFCELLGLGWSVAAGGLTLAMMILPLFVRVVEQGLRGQPPEWRLAGAALGIPRWRLLIRVLVPAAAPSIGAGLLLSTGRVLAESAALLFTAGTAIRMPGGPLDSGRTLATHIWLLAIEVPGGLPRACTAALVLVAIILATTLAARALPNALAARVLTR